jgi:hypothetical protein
MNQLVLRNFEERMIAEEHPQDHPRRGRGEHDRAHDWGVEIAHDLLERKHDSGQRRIKCGCDRRRRSHRDEILNLFSAQSEQASEHGSDASTDLHRRPFASEWDPAGKCR